MFALSVFSCWAKNVIKQMEKNFLVHKKDSNNRVGLPMPSRGSESYVLSRGRAKNKKKVCVRTMITKRIRIYQACTIKM